MTSSSNFWLFKWNAHLDDQELIFTSSLSISYIIPIHFVIWLPQNLTKNKSSRNEKYVF